MSWSILCFQESLRSVNQKQLPCKWHRAASTKRCWKSSPAKIFHGNSGSSGERRLKFIASGKDDDNKKPRGRESIASTGKVVNTATTTCTKAATEYYNYTVNETDEKREHRCRRFKKRWGDQATLEVYSQNYHLRGNGRHQQLHDLYNAREKYFSNARTEDSRQPLHHEQQCSFFFI